MALVFYVATTGSDNNGGSSEGSAKVSGSGAATTGASATVALIADLPNLSTVVVGDTIRLNGRTDGKNSSDIFEITAVDDGLDTVTVTPTPGTTTSGVTWAIGGAWATIDRSMNVVSAGDKVWIKSTASYNETATVDRVGTASNPIVFEGYTTTTGDGGRATLDGQATRGTCITTGLGAVSVFYVFKNLRLTNSVGNGVDFPGGQDRITFKNCKSDTNSAYGFLVDSNCLFENCEAPSNDIGFQSGSGSGYIGCTAIGNGTDGFSMSGGMCFGCLSSSNGQYGFLASGTAAIFWINCTVDGDSKDSDKAFYASSASVTTVTIINCIAYDCTVGIHSGANLGDGAVSRNNLVNGNTTAYTNAATFSGEVTSAPAFLNEATQDYRLDPSSPAKAAGYDGGTLGAGSASKMDIGAIQRAEPDSAITAVISEQPVMVDAYGAEGY